MAIQLVLAKSGVKREPGWHTYDPQSPTRDPEVPKLFTEMAQTQRGAPERAMLRVQKANVGGVLSPVVEHVGDLTHRIAEHVGDARRVYKDAVLTDIVLDKAEKTKRWLDHPYGFRREHEENLRANAHYSDMTYEAFKARVDKALEKYLYEHMGVPTYNEPQFLCRRAAIQVGKQEFEMASFTLGDLIKLIKSPQWLELALSYKRDRTGEIEVFADWMDRGGPINWPKKVTSVE